ncbi:hypothetical protein ED733_000342 [Metarhizium rileyi]|uniref:Threonine/serine exporter-like N-terminal domain-containing protein n=1 Tax=Metarhizium rileyi (strain RCEF 4871) TaxID=1649241 RepID=A0A5C6G121_METRR|nr:hypothetical protein ED733_000342 [Metarhizium rileyi]
MAPDPTIDNTNTFTNSNSNTNTNTASTPNRKAKKRVVWHSSSQDYGKVEVTGGSPASPILGDGTTTTTTSSVSKSTHAAATAAGPTFPSTLAGASPSNSTGSANTSRNGSGTPIPTVEIQGLCSEPSSPRMFSTPPGAPDAVELRMALNLVLTEEEMRRQEHSSLFLATPRAPRPALRRNTSYDDPEEREKADQAERRATERQLRSMNDARQRADRLAVSVGGYSSSGSRRNSDSKASFQPLIADSDDREGDYADDTAVASEDDLEKERVKHRTPYSRRQRFLEEHDTVESLVGSHTQKGGNNLFHERSGSSGTNTPGSLTTGGDYVPRPRKYRGSVLSSLLKLHQYDRRTTSNNTSGQLTPISLATPVMSPRPSPPTSRPSSAAGESRSRFSSGLFSNHRALQSASSLTELVKSSSMFAAPGSSEISDHWSETFKKEKAEKTHRPRKDQIRIKIHIAGIISRHKYLLKLCRALMLYGAPTHRLEEYMTMSSRVLEIEGQFLYIPSCMIISFDDSTTHTAEVKIVRVPQGIDLGKLRDVHNIYKDVVHDKLGVVEATDRLEKVMSRKPKFHTWFRVPMYGIASACVAPFAFEGRFIDLPVAFILGCIVGLLQLVFAPSNELYAHVFEVSASVITSFLARGFGSINNGQLFCFSALAQSSIALILPGYMVLCSSLELQSHNIVAGSVRMVYAMIYTLFLGYGITIGASLYGMMDSNATSATHCKEPLDYGWYFLFVPGFTLCLCIINQAKWGQTPVMTVMALAGFSVNSYFSKYFEGNSQISNMLGALTVGILANLYSRLGRHVENAWLDALEWWEYRVRPRFSRRRRPDSDAWSLPSMSDPESSAAAPKKQQHHPRKVGYSLAAAAMLPAIFVQVPSGLAAGGSLLAGITSANQLTGNSTTTVDTSAKTIGNLDGTAFNVLFSVIQVAIGISVGLFMSALIVYPLGKRRSGLFSF